MDIILGIFIGLFVLMALVVAHEFGHFIAARRNGVRVKEFGIGFPPRALAWVKGADGKWHRISKADRKKPQKNLVFSLNWLPIGGFCAMDGESDADTKKGTFGASTFWQKTKILFAGVAANWLVAFLVLTVLACTGMPQFIPQQFSLPNDRQLISEPVLISGVLKDSPAARAGFKANDHILSINHQNMLTGNDVTQYNSAHAGQTLNYTILRDGQKQQLQVTLNPAQSKYLLGVSMSSSQVLYRSTWSAPIVGAVTTVQLTGETFRGLGDLVWKLCTGLASQINPNDSVRKQGRQNISKAGDSVSGPVGIIGVIFPAFSSTGPTNLAFLAALISVSLACINVIPIPALDGGRWTLIAIFRLLRKKLSKATEEKIVGRAFLALLALFVLVTILDISRFF